VEAEDMPVNAVIFDLDGTLLNHFQAIYRSFCFAQEKLGLPPVDYETVKQAVGGPDSETVGRLVEARFLNKALPLYERRFDEIYLENAKLLPGAQWITQSLRQRGCATAIVTNKGGRHARGLMRELELDHLYDCIFGVGDTPYYKPDARLTHRVLHALATPPEESCVIGDSPYDIATAEAVGIPCYTVTTGTSSREALADAGSNGVFDDLFQLGEEVLGLKTAKPPTIQSDP
jgi:phosphoglycolate phosphatase